MKNLNPFINLIVLHLLDKHNGWALDGGIQWGDPHNRVNDWINKTKKK